jgi:hypothetical protein
MPLRAKDTSYSNHQLNLFNTLESSIAAIVIASSIHAVHTATDQPSDSPALEKRSSSNGGGSGSIGPVIAGLEQANERLIDLLYQLTIVQKMDYQAALEIAMNEWGSLPSQPAT